QVAVRDHRQVDAGHRAEAMPQIEARVDLQQVERARRIALEVHLHRPDDAGALHDFEAELRELWFVDELEERADAGVSWERADLLAEEPALHRAALVDVRVEA